MKHILICARQKKGRKIFEIFSSKGPSEFLVVSRARDDYQRMLVTQEEESRRRTKSELWSQSKLGGTLSMDCKNDVQLLREQ